MIVSNYSKVALMFLLMSATLFVNIDDNLLARMGLTNPGLMILVALIISVLAASRKLAVIVLIGTLCLLTNMPQDFVLNFGIDREIYLGLMISLLFSPILVRIFNL